MHSLNLNSNHVHHSEPENFKTVVVAGGDFHSTGHFAFAVNEGFHDSKYGWSKALLHREKIPKHIESFEGDSFRHVTTLILLEQI